MYLHFSYILSVYFSDICFFDVFVLRNSLCWFLVSEEDVDVDDVLAEDTAVRRFYSYYLLSTSNITNIFDFFSSQDFTKVETSDTVKVDNESETVSSEP